MKIYLVIYWEDYEQDVILSACKTKSIAEEIIRDLSQNENNYNVLIRSGYDVKEMDVVE